MIVQQPVVILVLSQEGERARPSTPPSWLIPDQCLLALLLCYCDFLFCVLIKLSFWTLKFEFHIIFTGHKIFFFFFNKLYFILFFGHTAQHVGS